MTIDRAIEMAIRAYENANIFNAKAIRDNVKPLIDEAVERDKGCGWCSYYKGVPLKGFTPHGVQSITVKYCPNCGKKLIEEDLNEYA